MERLTFEGNFCEIAQCACMKCPYDTDCSQKQVWERLKAYEDSKLSPEDAANLNAILRLGDGMTLMRLRELAVADQKGRVIVLPCKVGDVVYGFYGEQAILPMVAKWIETNTDGWTVAAQYAPMSAKFYLFSDFGKTVFLTSEEAKKALEARK